MKLWNLILKGKKALVTGGGSDLGKECALIFARGGADVLIADLKPERCEEVANMTAFLCTEEARYITSQNIGVDDGYTF